MTHKTKPKMANTRRPNATQLQQQNQTTTKTPPNPLITAAEHFLSLRNYTETLTYATRAQLSDPTHPSPPHLISIATVLSTPPISLTRPDFYSILNLIPFEANIVKIKNSFKNLTACLNPNVNKFPFSSEAFDLVLKAWAVLSDPVEKLKFDDELRMTSNCDATFWTMCPYCYHVFEFEKMYEDCCLRCSSEGCRRVFTSVAIGTPPKDVIEAGKYKCVGFMPVEGNVWVPFVNGVGKKRDCEEGFVINVSDDENVVEGNGNGESTKTSGGNDENVNENVFSVDGVEMDWSECLDIIGDTDFLFDGLMD